MKKNMTLFVGLLIIALTIQTKAQNIGSNYEKHGNSITFYPFTKYYHNMSTGEWRQVDETFYTYGCIKKYNFCTHGNLYQVHAALKKGKMLIIRNGTKFKMEPKKLYYRDELGNKEKVAKFKPSYMTATGNKITFVNAFAAGADLSFSYTGDALKESLKLAGNTTLPPPSSKMTGENITLDIDTKIEFPEKNLTIWINGQLWNYTDDEEEGETTGSTIELRNGNTTVFFIPAATAYERETETLISLLYDFEIESGEIETSLKTPYSWLMNTTINNVTSPKQYPVIIDPTTQIKDSNIYWNGYEEKEAKLDNPITYTRISNPAETIQIGRWYAGGWQISSRSDFDINLSIVPDNANIINASFTYYVQNHVGTEKPIEVNHMETGDVFASDFYADTNGGNKLFWRDIGNGTDYNSSKPVIGAMNTIYLTNNLFPENITARLASNNFSFGLDTFFPWTGSNRYIIRSRDHPTANTRPYLNITWDTCRPNGITNWLINETCYIQDEAITNPFNTTIQDNGYLILENTTVSHSSATHSINILIGGKLKINDSGGFA